MANTAAAIGAKLQTDHAEDDLVKIFIICASLMQRYIATNYIKKLKLSALTAFTGTRTSQQLCGQKRRLE